jgi:hypothetical protein
MTPTVEKRIAWSIIITIGLILLLGFIGQFIAYKEVSYWICPITGSTRTKVTWFKYFSHEERTVSALEKWLKRRETTFEPNWQHLSTDTYFVLIRSFADAGTPEIYQLRPILDQVVEDLSDARLAELVEVLRHGSRDEQRQMIKNISDEVFAKK